MFGDKAAGKAMGSNLNIKKRKCQKMHLFDFTVLSSAAKDLDWHFYSKWQKPTQFDLPKKLVIVVHTTDTMSFTYDSYMQNPYSIIPAICTPKMDKLHQSTTSLNAILAEWGK